jgi:FkbM family methyltransferase
MNEQAPNVAFTMGGKQVTLRFASGQDHIARTIAATGNFYEAELLADVRSRLFFAECAVDVGAHVGNHTLYFSKMLGLKTVAFEPNAQTFELLQANVRDNDVETKCRLRHAAVGAAAGRVRAVAAAEGNSGMARVEPDTEGDVPLLCLDDELQDDDPINVVKIDVEGWELDVLRGAERIIERHRPLIYVEASDASFSDVRAFLAARRYVCWKRFNATPTFLFMPNERLGAN